MVTWQMNNVHTFQSRVNNFNECKELHCRLIILASLIQHLLCISVQVFTTADTTGEKHTCISSASLPCTVFLCREPSGRIICFNLDIFQVAFPQVIGQLKGDRCHWKHAFCLFFVCVFFFRGKGGGIGICTTIRTGQEIECLP